VQSAAAMTNHISTSPRRLKDVFAQGRNLLNVYFTGGFPALNDTVPIIKALEKAGADIVEIGIPFSDPLADGPTIQESSQRAIDNGMTLPLLLDQLANIRQEVQIPLILMGYLNPILQYGMEKFCQRCGEIGIDGIILPDLPLQEYIDEYETLFKTHNLTNIFLITPQTSEARIRRMDEHSESFIYMVSSASTTGAKSGISSDQEAYFGRIATMQLRSPRLIGFGISNRESFERACQYANGAIIGSAFIKLLSESHHLDSDINRFVKDIKGA
jgi:tryptophan synthase alpha chain